MNECVCGDPIFEVADFCSATCWDLYHWDLEVNGIDELDPNEL